MRVSKDIMLIADQIKQTVDCEKIYLFGSHAYGTPHKNSDFDFYVVIPDDSIRPLEARRKIYKMLGQINGTVPIDVLANYASEFAKISLLPTLERQIVREGVVLYEHDRVNAQMV